MLQPVECVCRPPTTRTDQLYSDGLETAEIGASAEKSLDATQSRIASTGMMDLRHSQRVIIDFIADLAGKIKKGDGGFLVDF